MSASTYKEISKTVEGTLAELQNDVDPTVVAYMFVRSALLAVCALRGYDRGAEMAYKLADEFALEVRQ